MAASFGGLRAISQTASSSVVSDDDVFSTLTEYVGKGGANVGDDLVILFDHLQYACKKIAALVASPYNSSLGKSSGGGAGGDGGASGRDKPKPLDIVSVSIPYYLTENLI